MKGLGVIRSVITAILVIVIALGLGSSLGAASNSRPAANERVAPESQKWKQCSSARRGLAFYRTRHANWLQLRGVDVAPKIEQPKSCSLVRYKLIRAKKAAQTARLAYRRWLESQYTLRDYAVKPGNHAWYKAIDQAQKVFPGTESWLLSCSDAEGGHGRWVRYGGGDYYPGYEYTDAVGNWLQFRWSTFKGMYRHALDHLLSRGYNVPRHLRDPGHVRAWLSPLATALAGGWARATGNDASHWSASWGRGC